MFEIEVSHNDKSPDQPIEHFDVSNKISALSGGTVSCLNVQFRALAKYSSNGSLNVGKTNFSLNIYKWGS